MPKGSGNYGDPMHEGSMKIRGKTKKEKAAGKKKPKGKKGKGKR